MNNISRYQIAASIVALVVAGSIAVSTSVKMYVASSADLVAVVVVGLPILVFSILVSGGKKNKTLVVAPPLTKHGRILGITFTSFGVFAVVTGVLFQTFGALGMKDRLDGVYAFAMVVGTVAVIIAAFHLLNRWALRSELMKKNQQQEAEHRRQEAERQRQEAEAKQRESNSSKKQNVERR